MKTDLRFRKPFCECKRLIWTMNMQRLFRLVGWIGFVLLVPLVAWANTDGTTARDAGDSGASAVWIFANLSFAGMRAQNSSSRGWRIIAFIFGFPGTLLSLPLLAKVVSESMASRCRAGKSEFWRSQVQRQAS